MLVHDEVDLDAGPPAAIHLDYAPEQFSRCFRLCRQLWRDGVDRADFGRMIARLASGRTLSAADRRAFKHVRARFKHLRFAYATYDRRHRYPRVLHWLVSLMGHLQDAFRNDRAAAVVRLARLLRLFLTPWPYRLVADEIDRFEPSSTAALRRYVGDQVAAIRRAIARPAVTPKAFHELRKIISRQVAFYDTLKTLYPSGYHDQVSRYLSTINGLMGSLHDTLIERRLRGELDYHADAFALPEEIRQRLATLADRYPTEPSASPASR